MKTAKAIDQTGIDLTWIEGLNGFKFIEYPVVWRLNNPKDIPRKPNEIDTRITSLPCP